MATELIFSDGHRVRVIGTNAPVLTLTLARANNEQIRLPSGETLAPGWINIQTEGEGEILVNPSQVAYVRDVDDKPQAEKAKRSLSDLEARQVRT